MSGGGFTADPEGLDRLAAGFEDIADRLDRQIGSFSASARIPPGLFGLLPIAHDAWRAYAQTAESALTGLKSIHSALQTEFAARLRADASNYRAADEDSSSRLTP